MANKQEIIPDKEPFFPEGSVIVLVAHVGIGIFFFITYFIFYSNIETIKMMMLGYYTLFSVFFLFIYNRQLRVRRIFLLWCVVGFIQLVFYFYNAGALMWGKWAFSNVLRALAGLPVVLALYQSFRRMSLQRAGKDLEIGIRNLSKPTGWDFVATVIIPVVALIVCLL